MRLDLLPVMVVSELLGVPADQQGQVGRKVGSFCVREDSRKQNQQWGKEMIQSHFMKNTFCR